MQHNQRRTNTPKAPTVSKKVCTARKLGTKSNGQGATPQAPVTAKKTPVQIAKNHDSGESPEARKALLKTVNQVLREYGRPPIDDDADSLPDPQNMDGLIANFDPSESPPEIVAGFLHQGSKGSLNGGSKTNKTWSLIDLAVSVASGTQWWGLETTQGKVLYINFEIQDHFFTKRVIAVCAAKSVQLDGQLDYFGFRGKAEDWSGLMLQLRTKLATAGYVLIIIDPIYKGLGGKDENKAGDVASLLNEIESLCVQSGAAVVYGHHFAKGSQKFKNVEDRGSGSGVWARDPDSILTITRLQETDCYTVESVLRNFPQLQTFGVRWEYPLMVPDEAIDITQIHEPGSAQTLARQDVLDVLRDHGELTHGEWFAMVNQVRPTSLNTFRRRVAELKELGQITQGEGAKRTDPWKVA